MVREEGVSSLARGVGPNVFRAILMNASQLASYDFFKAELLKTPYFEDNIACHFTASFAAVSNPFPFPFASGLCLCGEIVYVC
jgi:solute carrier family 25 (mitochondrial dicarboxylate transporter), member 10